MVILALLVGLGILGQPNLNGQPVAGTHHVSAPRHDKAVQARAGLLWRFPFGAKDELTHGPSRIDADRADVHRGIGDHQHAQTQRPVS